MTNYSELTDHQINELVFFAQNPSSDEIMFDWLGDNCGTHQPDYCNSPEDAWPIILENKIHIGWAFNDMWRAEITNQGMPGPFKKWDSLNENPLRAACVVYLMMKEQDNE